jgi:hypothetical protein
MNFIDLRRGSLFDRPVVVTGYETLMRPRLYMDAIALHTLCVPAVRKGTAMVRQQTEQGPQLLERAGSQLDCRTRRDRVPNSLHEILTAPTRKPKAAADKHQRINAGNKQGRMGCET